MEYEVGKQFETIEAQLDFIYRVCKGFDKFIIEAGNDSVFDSVKQEMEEEAKAEGEEEKIETPGKKGKGKKNPLG